MLRIGIIGCGGIAHKLAAVMNAMSETVKLEAAASRSLDKAQAFCEEFGIKKAYGSYEELYNDKDVDLVYVATPHSHHKEEMIDILNHGKDAFPVSNTRDRPSAIKILQLGCTAPLHQIKTRINARCIKRLRGRIGLEVLSLRQQTRMYVNKRRAGYSPTR